MIKIKRRNNYERTRSSGRWYRSADWYRRRHRLGIATGKATEAISRQPEASGKIQTNLLLGAALAEGTAIFGFVVALLIILFLG